MPFCCDISAQAVVFPALGHFFIVQNLFFFSTQCDILRGAMTMVNGGLAILPDVCDDPASAHAKICRGIPAEDSDPCCEAKWENQDHEIKVTHLFTVYYSSSRKKLIALQTVNS